MRPPGLAQWIVARSLVASERDAVLGDLAEEFDMLATNNGGQAARRWYWHQALRSTVPNIWRRLMRPATPTLNHQRAAAIDGGFMDGIFQDARFAWRMIRQRPLVTSASLASLAVGISLAATVFSVVNAVILRPLPVRDPDALAVLLSVRADGINHNFSYPDFADYRAGQRTFTDLFAFSGLDVTIHHPSGSRVVTAELVSGSYFDTLGVAMRFGRGLADADDRAGAPPVAVVSGEVWRLVGGDPQRFDRRTVTINTRPFDIVGVVGLPFGGMEVGRGAHVWIPLHAEPSDRRDRSILERRTASWLTVMGRLVRGVSRERAAAELQSVEQVVAQTVKRNEARVLTLAAGRQGDSVLPQMAASPLLMLLAAACLVLLVGCANVANLLLARSTERAREIAVRAALGAGRGRLTRLVVLEALLIAIAGGACALLIATWAGGLMVPFLSRFGEPVTLDVPLDWRMFGFVGALAVSATVLSGLAPMFGIARSTPGAVLAAGARSSAAPGTARLRRGLIVVQFAVSLTLVVTAMLLGRTVYNLRTVTTGFDLEHVALLGVDPSAGRYDAARAQVYLRHAEDRLAAIPGVRAVAAGRIIPLGFGGSRMSIAVPGYRPGHDEDMEINNNVVSARYFEATGIPIVAGRAFEERDTQDAVRVAIVNETMAARYWVDRNPVGERFHLGDDKGPVIEVIGVARDVKYRLLRESANPSFYRPYAQTTAGDGVIHVRTDGDPAASIGTLRTALASVDPAVPVTTVRTLRDQAIANVNDERLAMAIAVTLGGAALLLAAVGLFASMSYTVGQRTREIGVRISLGATSGNILGLVLKQAVALTLTGAVVGAGFAVLLARALESRLFGIAPSDTATLVLSTALLAAVALVASWLPARRAARVDPAHALRDS